MKDHKIGLIADFGFRPMIADAFSSSLISDDQSTRVTPENDDTVRLQYQHYPSFQRDIPHSSVISTFLRDLTQSFAQQAKVCLFCPDSVETCVAGG